jgi:hypothetical protein
MINVNESNCNFWQIYFEMNSQRGLQILGSSIIYNL